TLPTFCFAAQSQYECQNSTTDDDGFPLFLPVLASEGRTTSRLGRFGTHGGGLAAVHRAQVPDSGGSRTCAQWVFWNLVLRISKPSGVMSETSRCNASEIRSPVAANGLE